MVLKQCAIVVTVFPADLRLAGLQGLQSAAERRQLLMELLPDQPDLWQADVRCLRYRPERRYVAELFTSGGKRVLLKFYTQKSYLRGKSNAVAFGSDGSLRVARLLGCSDRDGLLAFEWLPGRLLMDLVTGGEADDGTVAAVGAALAVVHKQNAKGLQVRRREAEAEELRLIAEEVGFVLPQLADQVGELAERLGGQLTDAPLLDCPLHGDFSANQVLVDGPGMAVIDFDMARRGDPAVDLGNFIAQAERYALRGELAVGRVEWLRSALLEGYCRATDGPPPARTGLYTAVRLLWRARYPFRTREPECLQRTESLLDRVEEILRMTHN